MTGMQLLLALVGCEPTECAEVWYVDADGDGYGAVAVSTCTPSLRHVRLDGDCDDESNARHPAADEFCNGIDDDCDGSVDEDAADQMTAYIDSDGDGFGDSDHTEAVCDLPMGLSDVAGDCDDEDSAIYPGAPKVCDGKDSDCDGSIEETRVPEDYSTIQSALDAGVDWVCVSPGTYAENIRIPPWDVVLEGHGADLTILDGGGAGSVVLADGGAMLTLGGLAIENGAAEKGAGILGRGGAFYIEDAEIRTNRCDSGTCWGTGMYIDAEDVILARVTVAGNTAISGEGVNGVGAALFASSLIVEDSSFVGNYGESSSSVRGVGLVVSNAVLQRSSISGNETVGGESWGTALYATVGDVRFTNSSVLGNSVTAESVQCGVVCQSESTLQAVNTAFVNNEVGSSDGCVLEVEYGGLVYLNNVDISSSGAEMGRGPVCAWDSGAGLAVDVQYSNFYPWTASDIDIGAVHLGDGLLNSEPGYVSVLDADPGAWDLTLSEESPLRDAGDPSMSDRDGSRSDIGALGGPDGR